MHTGRLNKSSGVKHTVLCIVLLCSTHLLWGQNSPTAFQDFYKRFESDCGYQKAHVDIPLQSLSYPDDPDEDEVDTVWLDEWRCYDSWSTFDIEIEEVSSGVWRVVYGIADTGVRVEYYFMLRDDEWYLNRIADLSM